MILVNLTCGRNPWKQASDEDSTFRAYRRNRHFLQSILPLTNELNDILGCIFTADPDRRITLPELRRRILACPQFTVPAMPTMAAPTALPTPPATPEPQEYAVAAPPAQVAVAAPTPAQETATAAASAFTYVDDSCNDISLDDEDQDEQALVDPDECLDDDDDDSDFGYTAPASPAPSDGSDGSLDSNCSTIDDDDDEFELRQRELQEEHQLHQAAVASSCHQLHHFHQQPQTPMVYEQPEMTVLMPQPVQPQFHPHQTHHQEYFAQHYSGPVPVMQPLPPVVTAPVPLPPVVAPQQQHMVVCIPPSKVVAPSPQYSSSIWDFGRQFIMPHHQVAPPTPVHAVPFYHQVPLFTALQGIY